MTIETAEVTVPIKDIHSDRVIEFTPEHIKYMKQRYTGSFRDQNDTLWLFSRHERSKTIRIISKFHRVVISFDDIPL